MMNEKKQVAGIAWITALCLLGDSALYIVLPIYWQSYGLDAFWQVGVLLAANRFIRLPLNPFVGWCYRSIGMRTGVMLSVLIAIVATVGYGWAHGFVPLLLLRLMWGIAWAFLRLGGYLSVMDTAPHNRRGELLGLYNGLWGIGSLAGMLAGGLLADQLGIAWSALLFGGINMAALPLCLLYLPKRKAVSVLTAETAPPEATATSRSRWRSREVLAVMAAAVSIGIVFFGVLSPTLSRLLQYRYPEGVTLLGWTLGAASLAGLLQALRWAWGPYLSPWFGKLSDGAFGRRRLFAAGLAAASLLFIAVALPLPLAVWLAVILLLQLANTLISTLMDALASDAAERNGRVAMMTSYTIAIDIGAAIGPLVGFPVIERFGVPALYCAAGVLVLANAIEWGFGSFYGRKLAKSG